MGSSSVLRLERCLRFPITSAIKFPATLPQKYFHTSSSRQDSDNKKFFPVKWETMLPPNTLKGKVAFITGGGTGLGKGIATTLSKLGAKVAISSRKIDVLKKTAEEVSKLSQNEILPVAADVRDPDAIKAAVDECVSAFGIPDIIINNAAGNFISPTERVSANAWKTIVDIVLNGTANVTLECGKRLIKAKKGGSFLSITTVYGKTGSGYVVPSAAAKAGVESLTKSLSAEWGKYGLRFNCIAPGPIETKGAFSRLVPDEKFVNMLMERIPAGRLGEIPELNNFAAYVVSDYASWLNGAILTFDGGESRHLAGEFNALGYLTEEQWDQVSDSIRKVKGS